MPSPAPIRIGLLGAARIAPGAVVRPAAERDDVDIVCVAARDPERARVFAMENGIPEVAPSYAALIARGDLDLIYIALPPHLHCEWAIAALGTGHHVLCEKPFALDAAEAREMVDAAAMGGRQLIEAFHYRFHPLMRQALDLVRSGAIGAVQSAEAWAEYPIPVRPGEPRWTPGLGGGALMDLGCYAVHALRTLLGGEPEVVSARQAESLGVDAETEAELLFPCGVAATMRSSMRPASPATGIRLTGDGGVLEYRGFILAHVGGKLTVSDRDLAPLRYPITLTTYAAQLDAIVDVLRGAKTAVTGGSDAIANMAAIDTIRSAARSASVHFRD